MAETLFSKTDRLLRFCDNLEMVEDWRRENFVRLAKRFGIKNDIVLKPDRKGFVRVEQGAEFPSRSKYNPFESFMQSYTEISGDKNGYWIGKRVRQFAGLPSFEDVLADVLNRQLWSDFGPTDYKWASIVTSVTSPRDYRQNVRTGVQYLRDLPTLIEDQPFVELTQEADVQGDVTYTINEYGAFITISRRVLINDDVGLIQRMVEQVKRSAWRTLAKRVWGLISSNATYGVDGQPLFSAAHGNVSTGAGATLSSSMLTTARTALFNQTELGGQDKLGLGGGPLLLVVPIQLEPEARFINMNPNPDASGLDSAWLHRFGRDCENIFANPLLTNAQDWYIFDISRNVQIVELGFLGGQQMPRFEVADNPLADETFTQDRITFKVSHQYEAAILDYRGCYAGLVS